MAVVTSSGTSTANQQLEHNLEKKRRFQLLALIGPGFLWLMLFFLAPLIVIVGYSFMTPGSTGRPVLPFTFDSYARLFTESLFVNAYLRSIWIGIVTTVLCLLLGYPLALFIVRQSPQWRTILLFLVLIPFWTNFLVRTYAWMIILQKNGLLNAIFQSFGMPAQNMMNTCLLYTSRCV